MAPLSSDQRKLLEKVIIKARQSAEAGAKNALEMLAVDRHEPHTSMSPEERALRNRLRARGRQLGDVRDKARGTQSIARLVHEVAYEFWHRMLFARFLTENHLLIETHSGVAISMEECEELAREAGEDPRSMAARFAQDSLPQIFRSGDPVLDVTLAPEIRQALDKLLDGLPSAVFTADDSLGWTYQYWQAEKKDAVNASGNKIGADELPAVTQLFTEHYMVLFLYHNTIGAWHAGKVLAENPSLAETAQNEGELREAVRLRSHGGYDFEYLRFVREANEGDEEDTPTGPWRPAAGTFDGWPKTAMELKVLDPCCGSGHFLAEGFELLVRLRMDEEGLEPVDAIRNVLAVNLYGLELDPRCTQIAAFNLALAAWNIAGKPIVLPPLQIACSGLAVGSTRDEWAKLAGNNERLRNGMEKLYDLFEKAPELGSLIDPRALKGDLLEADYSELHPLLELALAHDSADFEDNERAVAALGMAKTAKLLTGVYTLVITNVPYLSRGRQSANLKEFADRYYPEAKADLATVFIQRTLKLLGKHGGLAGVTPQNWLFLDKYKKLRKFLLQNRTWDLVARLGAKSFQTPMWDFNVMLVILSASRAGEDHLYGGADVSHGETYVEKARLLGGEVSSKIHNGNLLSEIKLVHQGDQANNPDCRILLCSTKDSSWLLEYASSFHGISTTDYARLGAKFWEIGQCDDWIYEQSTVPQSQIYSGREHVIRWGQKGQYLQDLRNSGAPVVITGLEAWRKSGVAVSQIGSLPATIYRGDAFDDNTAVLVPRKDDYFLPIWMFCSSPDYSATVRDFDQSLKVTYPTLVKVPFDLEHWKKIAIEKYPNGLPEPHSNDPTQWLFHGHPANADSATVLQVAVGRLLGYFWPPEIDSEMHLADEARAWVDRCNELNELADEDGIVCLSATRGERTAAERLREMLSAAIGPTWSAGKERELLTVAGDGKNPAASLEVWLRDKFFEEHCKLFHHRPFVWHIWDGNKEGFHCLVNAQKLTGPNGEGRRTLEAITYSYLGDWVDRQKADQAEGKEGADARLASAQDLQGQLVKILEGEQPYDIFVRWKPLHEQAIGWDPDINDGVRLNARPFMNAELSKGGKKGAGVLRWKPNIKWNKDRGKEPQSLRPKADFPWFWSCDDGAVDFTGGNDFDGNRWNNLHYSIAFKQTARERSDERK